MEARHLWSTVEKSLFSTPRWKSTITLIMNIVLQCKFMETVGAFTGDYFFICVRCIYSGPLKTEALYSRLNHTASAWLTLNYYVALGSNASPVCQNQVSFTLANLVLEKGGHLRLLYSILCSRLTLKEHIYYIKINLFIYPHVFFNMWLILGVELP